MSFTENFVRKQLERFKPLLADAALESARKAHKAVGDLMRVAEKPRVRIRRRVFPNFEAAWILPAKTRQSGAVLYLHGGGYACGGAEYAMGFGSVLSAACGVKVFGVAYRLAPEFPFPAALEDALESYRYLLSCGLKGEEIALCGESAGGGLIYCLCLRLKELNLPLPAGIVAISPWTDLTCSGETCRANAAADPSMTESYMRRCAALYGGDPLNPLVSPLFGDLEGMPPSLLFAGGDEIMLDDARRMHEALLRAGCRSRLIVTPRMWHAYVLYGLKEHRKSDFAAIAAFLKESLAAARGLRWLRLDNAAKIFPAASRKHWSNVFRLSATLSETVDPAVLQQALDATVRRFPSIAVRLRRGVFWYYLEEVDFAPDVRPDSYQPLKRMNSRDVRNCAFRVLYYRDRVAAEFFHALTDGTGGLIFLKTLVAEYLSRRYGAVIPCEDGVLDRLAEPDMAELEDSFVKNAGGAASPRKEEHAFHLTGKTELDRFLHVTCGTLDTDEALEMARHYGASLTAFLAAALVYCILEIQQKRVPIRALRRPVKVQIPVNLRRLFESRTLRNFVMVVNTGVDPRMGDYRLEEIVDAVRCKMGLDITPQRMRAAFTTNVNSEKSIALRLVPLPLKNLVMKTIFDAVGETAGCLTLSNLGAVKIPEAMQPYVKRFDFILGAQAAAPYNCGVCSYGGKLRVNIVRNTVEPELEKRFFRFLRHMGLHVTVESNQR